ncbi:DOPA 4,5-dioxygenase family protein [Klebsiella pneumoniae]
MHPITDNELRDHRDWPLWLGQVRPLDLSTLADE